ncbi:MAG: cysteine--tRNA ligase [Deltaproteobacteria bacterium]|nr:cysteine--tRNA ligase [Candidatus Anaeroferrophillus wilburensis]MBN2889721.1 cysteine--tRNA ligase [Deltaproteobacteria bacterium]
MILFYPRGQYPTTTLKRRVFLQVYNTLTGKKEEFVPLFDRKVGIYACGVTVYDLCHIGHARSLIVFDVIYRYLSYKGYDVKYVRNFTDVDDKIIRRAEEQQTTWKQLAKNYIREFYTDMDRLQLKRPTAEPRATDHIEHIIALVQKLEANGLAYTVDGDVFFRIKNFPAYGKLSGKKIDDLLSGARIDVDDRKESPLDFALWKKSKPGEPSWNSPWGSGRPGWHIECSAMSQYLLGETFDIHGGGKDLVFPHHENEIAQSEGATGKPFVRYWLHNGFVNINKEKMSKSLGNFFTIREILQKYHPETLRLFILASHYRSPIDFSWENMDAAGTGLTRLYQALERLQTACQNAGGTSPSPEKTRTALTDEIAAIKNSFIAAMDDDFNTALAVGCLFDAGKCINRFLDNHDLHDGNDLLTAHAQIKEMADILGILQSEPAAFLKSKGHEETLSISEEEIQQLIEQRNQARKEKQWAAADSIRDRLAAIGIILKDTAEGTGWQRK